jgi:hypothetical protein
VRLGKVYEGWLHLRKEGRKQVSGLRKVVERDPTWSWPCEELKLPQRRHWNHGLVILNFGKQILMSPLLCLPIYLLVLLCFHSISYDVLHCLVDIVYIYLYVYLEGHRIFSVN